MHIGSHEIFRLKFGPGRSTKSLHYFWETMIKKIIKIINDKIKKQQSVYYNCGNGYYYKM